MNPVFPDLLQANLFKESGDRHPRACFLADVSKDLEKQALKEPVPLRVPPPARACLKQMAKLLRKFWLNTGTVPQPGCQKRIMLPLMIDCTTGENSWRMKSEKKMLNCCSW